VVAGKVPNGDGPWENVTTRAPAKFATTAYLLYDDKNLYIGFKSEQAGVPIVATQTTNDVGSVRTISSASGYSTGAVEAKPIILKRRLAARASSRPMKRALSAALERRR